MALSNDALYAVISKVINGAFRRLNADQRFDLTGETYTYFLGKKYETLTETVIIRKALDIATRELKIINDTRTKCAETIVLLGDNPLVMNNPWRFLTPHVDKTTRLMEKLATLAPYSSCLAAVLALYQADADVDDIRDALQAKGSSSLTCMLRREIAAAERAMTETYSVAG